MAGVDMGNPNVSLSSHAGGRFAAPSHIRLANQSQLSANIIDDSGAGLNMNPDLMGTIHNSPQRRAGLNAAEAIELRRG